MIYIYIYIGSPSATGWTHGVGVSIDSYIYVVQFCWERNASTKCWGSNCHDLFGAQRRQLFVILAWWAQNRHDCRSSRCRGSPQFPTSRATCLSRCVVLIGVRLVYHPDIFSTMAESIAETNENVARKRRMPMKKKQSVFFCIPCVESPVGVKQHNGRRIAFFELPSKMCKVCTEAVHCVALWTRTLSQVWACVKYVPKQCIHSTLGHGVVIQARTYIYYLQVS